MNIAVVGAGPAGSLFAHDAVRGGATVTIFDASHPREKPCGGGLTAKALDLLPPAPASDPLPARWIEACRFESGTGEWVDVRLRRSVALAARRDLDAWLLRRATEAGAVHRAERVVEVAAGGAIRTASGPAASFDVVVGADGAGSLVRRTFLSPTPPERRAMATGWFARGTSEMVVRFTPGLAGYLWLFPRPDHVGVGICAPLTAVPSKQLLDRLESEIGRAHPALLPEADGRYAHTIPSPSGDAGSLAEIAGREFALIGDAAALADPLTGEGIYYALASARLLAETLLEDGSPRRYPERVIAGFGQELLRAARLHDRFFRPGFAPRMVSYAARSTAIRDVLGDLVLGTQGYSGLKRRLVRAGPRFVVQAARSWLRGA